MVDFSGIKGKTRRRVSRLSPPPLTPTGDHEEIHHHHVHATFVSGKNLDECTVNRSTINCWKTYWTLFECQRHDFKRVHISSLCWQVGKGWSPFTISPDVLEESMLWF